MDDPRIRFVDNLIRDSIFAARMYFACASVLWAIALCLFGFSVLHPSAISLEKMAGIVPTVFGAIPMPLGLIARNRRAALTLLRDEWEEAQANHDESTIEKLRLRFQELQTKGLDAEWGKLR